MRLRSIATIALFAASSAFANPRIHRGPTSPKVPHASSATAKPHVSGIDGERATQIQTALIKAGYLTGAPTGQWDSSTQGAMEKLQADNGWQTKLVPDARAIIKLGLGPGSTPPAATATHETPEPGTNGNVAN